jgi:hypothetical protein
LFVYLLFICKFVFVNRYCYVNKKITIPNIPIFIKLLLNEFFTLLSRVDNPEQEEWFVLQGSPRRNNIDKIADFVSSLINREVYLAKSTEKFILGRYLLSGILLILLSLRPWGVAARPAILENRGAKSHFCDYFIIRARYLYLSYLL